MGDIWRATKGKQKVRVPEQKGSARTRGGHVPVTYTSVQHTIQEAKRQAKIPANATHVTGSDRTTGEKVKIGGNKKRKREPAPLTVQAIRAMEKEQRREIDREDPEGQYMRGQRKAAGVSKGLASAIERQARMRIQGYDLKAHSKRKKEQQKAKSGEARKRAEKARKSLS